MIADRVHASRYLRRTLMTLTALAMAGTLTGCAMLGFGAKNPLVGTWNLDISSQLGDSTQVLTVADDLTGGVTLPDDGGTMEISETTVEDNAVTFKITFNIQGEELPATFEGTIEGDSISGEYVTELGNATVTGTRGG